MAIATGVGKQLGFKKQSSFGTPAGASSAQLLRRVTSSLNLVKNTYESNEIRSDYQVADFRHGTRRVEGTIAGELSGGTYQAFFEALLRAAGSAVADITGLTLDVALVSGSSFTITRSTGSWVTDGVRVGAVIEATAGLNAASLNKNLLVTALTATVATVYVLNGTTLTVESAVSSCTVKVPGKRVFVPTTGHTDDSFTMEEWHGDLGNLSRRFDDCKISKVDLKLPATGMVTCDWGVMGRNMVIDTSQYFTTPSAATTTGVMAAVNGSVLVDGVPIALITGMDLTVDGSMTNGEVIGSNVSPDIFEGRVKASGQMTVYLQDSTFADYFLDESEVEVVAVMNADNTANSNFISVHLPRIKLGSATVDDGEKGLIQTCSFTALKKATTTGYDATTIVVQDSQFA
jgi:hypothetical protein